MLSFFGVQVSVLIIPDEGPCCELVKKLNTHMNRQSRLIILVIMTITVNLH